MDTFTPELLAENLRNNIKTPFDDRPFVVEGLYKQSDNGRSYKGYYYCQLQDPKSNLVLTVKVHEKDYDDLTDETIYKLQGIFQRTIQQTLAVKLNFVVTKVLENKGQDHNKSRVMQQAVKAKHLNGFKNIESLIHQKLRNKEKINLLLLTGMSSNILQDVSSGLEGAEHYFDISIANTNLSEPDDIVKDLKLYDNQKHDLIALVRGGGNYLEVFNSLQIVKLIPTLSTPIITALGHKVDVSITDFVADKYVATPTKLGQYLKDVYTEFTDKQRQEEEHTTKIQSLIESNQKLSQKLDNLGARGNSRDIPANTRPSNNNFIKYILFALLGAIVGISIFT